MTIITLACAIVLAFLVICAIPFVLAAIFWVFMAILAVPVVIIEMLSEAIMGIVGAVKWIFSKTFQRKQTQQKG